MHMYVHHDNFDNFNKFELKFELKTTISLTTIIVIRIIIYTD